VGGALVAANGRRRLSAIEGLLARLTGLARVADRSSYPAVAPHHRGEACGGKRCGVTASNSRENLIYANAAESE